MDIAKNQFGIGLIPCNSDCKSKVQIVESELQLRKSRVTEVIEYPSELSTIVICFTLFFVFINHHNYRIWLHLWKLSFCKGILVSKWSLEVMINFRPKLELDAKSQIYGYWCLAGCSVRCLFSEILLIHNLHLSYKYDCNLQLLNTLLRALKNWKVKELHSLVFSTIKISLSKKLQVTTPVT